jgi:SAM-dependent methyltransferase
MLEVELSNDIKNKTKEEARRHLRGFYEKAFQSHLYKPFNSYKVWCIYLNSFKPFRERKKPFTKALEVGCGLGFGVSVAREKGHDVWGIDIAGESSYWKNLGVADYCVVSEARKMPFRNGEFDYILTSDVMEHIPEFDVVDTLKEIRRVGSNEYHFVIHMEREKQPIKTYTSQYGEAAIYTHICIKPQEWWLEKVNEAKYKIIDWHVRESHIAIFCKK